MLTVTLSGWGRIGVESLLYLRRGAYDAKWMMSGVMMLNACGVMRVVWSLRRDAYGVMRVACDTRRLPSSVMRVKCGA